MGSPSSRFGAAPRAPAAVPIHLHRLLRFLLLGSSTASFAVLIFWSARSANGTLFFFACSNTSMSVRRNSSLLVHFVSRSRLRNCASVGDSLRPQSHTQIGFRLNQPSVGRPCM